jgi:hypothetical protein
MARGRQRVEWERVAWLGATVLSMWSKKPIDPRKINPFEPQRDDEEVVTDAEWAAFVKGA